MLRNLKYKTRLMLLGLSVPIFAFVCYYSAVEKTVLLWKENEVLSEQQGDATNIQEQIQLYKEKTKVLDNIYTLTVEGSRHETILKNVSSFCQQNGILIRDFPAAKVYVETNYEIENTQFIVDGAFVDILNLLYHIENQWKLGRVASVVFETVMDRQIKKKRLQAKIFIQNIKRRSNEK